jgi:DNA-binding HxlR family transcriptional regulator
MSVRGELACGLPSTAVAASAFNRALGVVGDRWALQILRDSFAGVRRFEDFKACSGAPRSTLTDRLKGLVDRGVLERVRYQNAPPRFEYRLSARGTELFGATLLLLGWEQVWSPRSTAPQPLRHKTCGHPMSPELICSLCGQPITFDNTEYEVLRVPEKRRLPAPLRRRLSYSSKQSRDGVTKRSLIELADVIGDRWSLMVLCAGFLGLRRYHDIQGAVGIATNILAHRLLQLVEHGMCSRRQYSEHPRRYEYLLTEKGRDLFPVAFMLLQWGDRWLVPGDGSSLRVRHQPCGRLVRGVVSCGRCAEPLRSHDVIIPLAAAHRPHHPGRGAQPS